MVLLHLGLVTTRGQTAPDQSPLPPPLSRGGVNPSMCIRALLESLTSFESYPKEAPWSHEGFCLMFGWGRAESSRVASVCFSVLEGGLFFRDFDKFLRSFNNSLNL